MLLLHSKYSYEANAIGTVQFGVKMGKLWISKGFMYLIQDLLGDQFYCSFHVTIETLGDKQKYYKIIETGMN
jgi:hypothetical protein